MAAYTAADWLLIKQKRNAADNCPDIFYQLAQPQARDRLTVRLITQKRRSIRLKITDTGEAELRCPKGLPRQQIKDFLARHTPWLMEQQAQVNNRLQRSQRQISIYGELYQIELQPLAEFTKNQKNSAARVSLDHDQKICRLSILKSDEAMLVGKGIVNNPDMALDFNQDRKQQLLDALRIDIKPIFQQCVDRWWPRYQAVSGDYSTKKPILRVKQMKTRWGSLSQRGYINLNMALIHYPPSVLDMVVVHELSHCQYFNHSPAFYDLMTAIKPDWRGDEVHLKNPKYRYL